MAVFPSAAVPLYKRSRVVLLVLATAPWVASNAPAASEYQCGPGGAPNKATKKCDCPAGKTESTDAKGVSKCVGAPVGSPPVPAPKPTFECEVKGMAPIPGGTYKDRWDVTVTVADFCLDVREVTVKAWTSCVTAGACTAPRAYQSTGMARACNWKHPSDRDEHPVNCVDWNQATGYCKWSSKTYATRLPTQHEWRWAARGGNEARKYPWGGAAPASGKLNACGAECAKHFKFDGGMYTGDDGYPETAPVGSYPASRWGLFDLAGNVREWTSDDVKVTSTYTPSDGGAPSTKVSTQHALLGGSFLSLYTTQVEATDDASDPSEDAADQYVANGLRCALSVH